jgi:prepilin-type N-terminal cleavage/methylation domain-containing protein
MNASPTQKGFSLVELSIVMVVIGLLVGGILGGQALIKAAELRAIGTERSRYVAAAQSFRDQFQAIPGDMTNASTYWGKDNSVCSGAAGTAATNGTCNGNGDNFVNEWSLELHRFWQQLVLAGLIEGQYTGRPGGGGASHAVIGTNAPRSRFSGAGWATMGGNYNAGDGNWWQGSYGNYLIFGAQTTDNPLLNGPLSPLEAWNVDSKLDDGVPGAGKIWTFSWGNCSTATSSSDYNKPYRMTDASKSCVLFFPNAY